MWDLPGPGIEPVPLALAGGFFTTEPPGKPLPQDMNLGPLLYSRTLLLISLFGFLN